MSAGFDPLALLKQNEEAAKGRAAAKKLTPAELLKMNEEAPALPTPIGFTKEGDEITSSGFKSGGTIGPETRPFYAARLPLPGGHDVSPADIAELMPQVLAQVASFGGAAKKTLPGIALTAGAGAAGDVAKQVIGAATGAPQWSLTSPLEEGAKQGGLEAVGRALGGAVKKIAWTPETAVREVEKKAAELGLPAPPDGWRNWAIENTMLGRYFAKKGAAPGIEKAAQAVGAEAEKLGVAVPAEELTRLRPADVTKLAKDVGSAGKAGIKAETGAATAAVKTQLDTDLAALKATAAPELAAVRDKATQQLESSVASLVEVLPPGEAGQLLQQAARGGSAVAGRQAQTLYGKVDTLAKDAVVDIGEWKARFAGLLDADSPFADPGLKRLQAKIFGTTGPDGAVIAGMPDTVTYAQARELQKDIGDLLPYRDLVSKQSKGAVKALWGELTGQIEEGLGARPGALAAFREANGFYRKFSDAARGGVMTALLKKDPEYFVKQLRPDGVTNAARLKQVVLDYAQEHGTPDEKTAAQEAWKQFQGSFVKQRLLADGVEALPQNLGKFDDKVLETVFDSTPGGKQLLKSTRLVSDAIEKASPEIERQIGEEAVRLRSTAAAATETASVPAAEKATALKRLKMIEDVVGRSAANSTKGSAWWSVAMGLGGAGFVAAKMAPAGAPIMGAELLGGYFSYALYHPAEAAKLAGAIEKAGTSLQVGGPALARLALSWKQRQEREKQAAQQYRYLDVPQAFLEDTAPKTMEPLISPPPDLPPPR